MCRLNSKPNTNTKNFISRLSHGETGQKNKSRRKKKKVCNKQGIGVPLKEMRYKLKADPRKKNE